MWLAQAHQDRLPTFKDLKGYKRQRLEELYDEAASPPEGKSYQPAKANFYLDGIRRQEYADREKWMVGLTVVIAVMTALILVATAFTVFDDSSSDEHHPRHGYHQRHR